LVRKKPTDPPVCYYEDTGKREQNLDTWHIIFMTYPKITLVR
jgi:hypothetical protein